MIPTVMHRFAKIRQVPSICTNLNWCYAIQPYIKDQEHGWPFETPFIHGDECETAYSLALFPEMTNQENGLDTKFHGFLPPGQVVLAVNAYQRPNPWYGHAGLGTIEIIGNPEAVVGEATFTDAETARPEVEALLDFMVKLHDVIIEPFPVGRLPNASLVTQRFNQGEVDELLKGPANGSKHLYTVAWPAC